MFDETPRAARRLYTRSFLDGLRIVWPVLSGILALEALLGATIGIVEGWGIGGGIYFAFITGLTIGYGDLVPHQALTQILSVVIGFSGIIVTGLFAGLAVKAFQVTREGQRKLGRQTGEP
jgi:hypothetical protein